MLVPITNYITNCTAHNLHNVMRAIVKKESKGNPFAIGVNGKYHLQYQAKNKAQALTWVNYLEQHHYNFDLGIAQVNIYNVHKYGYTVSQALDPCTNLKIANDIFAQDYKLALDSSSSNTEALQKAISAYNTGNFTSGFSNGYVHKVLANMDNMSFTVSIAQNDKLASKSKTVIYVQNNSNNFAMAGG